MSHVDYHDVKLPHLHALKVSWAILVVMMPVS